MKLKTIVLNSQKGYEYYKRIFDTEKQDTIVKTPEDAIKLCAESICVNHINLDTFMVFDENDDFVCLKRATYQNGPARAKLTWLD